MKNADGITILLLHSETVVEVTLRPRETTMSSNVSGIQLLQSQARTYADLDSCNKLNTSLALSLFMLRIPITNDIHPVLPPDRFASFAQSLY